ncbi:hypothetical protein HID58_033776, partial [Brassica napus]
FNDLLENFSLCLPSSSNRRPGVCPSIFESFRLSRSSQSIAYGFLASGKDREFVRIKVLFFDEKIWLGKSVMSRTLTSPKKQLESLFVSSLICKKQSTHNSL